MAQALIRNLDDELLADYRRAAKRNERSLEAELREGLTRARPTAIATREELIALSKRIRDMTPAGVKQTPSEQLVREDRDSH